MDLDNSESDYSVLENVSRTDCINLANRLIVILDLNIPEIRDVCDIQSTLFIQLFDKIFGMEIPELIRCPMTYEEECINLNAIINTISLDILSVSLYHIFPEDILDGNIIAIYDLLEIFEGCATYYQSTQYNLDEGETLQSGNLDSLLECESNEALQDEVVSTCRICGYQPGLVLPQDVQLSSCPICKEHVEPSHSIHPQTSTVKRVDIPSDRNDGMQEEIPASFKKKSRILADSVQSSDVIGTVYKPDFVHDELPGPSTRTAIDLTCPGTSKDHWLHNKMPLAASPPHSLSQAIGVRSVQPTGVFKDVPVTQKKGKVTGIISKKSKSLDEIYDLKYQSALLPEEKETQTSDVAYPERVEGYVKLKPKLKQHKPQHHERVSTTCPEMDEIAKMFQENMKRKVKLLNTQTRCHQESARIKKRYVESLRAPRRKPVSPICRKSFLLPYYLKYPSYRTSSKKPNPRVVRISQVEDADQRKYLGNNDHSPGASSETAASEEEILPFLKELKEAFPGLQLSPATIRVMKLRHEKHLKYIHRELKEALLKKPRIQVQAEEAVKRQKVMADILRKEINQNKKANAEKENKSMERQIKSMYESKKMQLIKARAYYNKFHADFYSKLRDVNHKETKIAKDMFNERCNLEKMQVQELKKQLKEKQQKEEEKYRIHLQALENLYETNFALLEESFTRSKHDAELQSKAAKEVLIEMERELMAQMEQEICRMQDEVLELQRDMHSRELQAEKHLETLRDRFSAYPLQ